MNEDKIIPLSSIMNQDEDIEVLDETDFTPITENEIKEEEVEGFIKPLATAIGEKIVDRPKMSENLVEKIQIGLIIFLIVSATLVYFFGYDLLEPFIKID